MKRAVFERSAEVTWKGDVVRGSGRVAGASQAFDTDVSFPTLRGETSGVTTPEELLAAAHAACYAIGLRSVIQARSGSASQIVVSATVSAEKGANGIRILRSHLRATIHQLRGLDPVALAECGDEAERECTISNALAGNVEITHEVEVARDEIEASS